MEITGKIIAVLPVQSGTSRSGATWQKAGYVLETQEQYPKKIYFTVFGADRFSQLAIRQDEMLTVAINIIAREWKGRWFNEVSAWNVSRVVQQQTMAQTQQMQQPQQQAMPQQPQNTQQQTAASASDDLPF